MKSRALRSTLLGVFVAVLGTAAYFFWAGESKARGELAAARAFDAGAQAVARALLDVRSAQQAYVAAGQGEAFWVSQVGTLTASLRREISALRRAAASPLAQSHLDEASSQLQDFERLDRQARSHALEGQRLLASDLIFADGIQKTAAALTVVEQARQAEIEARTAAAAAGRRQQWAAAAAAAIVGLLTVLALVPLPASEPETIAADDQPVPAPAVAPAPAPPQPETSFDLLRDPRDGSWSPLRPASDPAHMKHAVNLGEVASVCTELARASETQALPRALERAAALLDASGVVLWIADPDGRELNPIVAHGYPPQIVTRLGTIPRDAENATAAAFRTALVQTVRADAVSNGAIAAPLVTPAGCVGVIAAEVRHGGEKHDAKLAAATIVAAQLASLVGPPSARAQAKAEAARA